MKDFKNFMNFKALKGVVKGLNLEISFEGQKISPSCLEVDERLWGLVSRLNGRKAKMKAADGSLSTRRGRVGRSLSFPLCWRFFKGVTRQPSFEPLVKSAAAASV